MKILHLDLSTFFHKVMQKSNLFESVELLNGTSVAEAWEILGEHQIDLIISGQELKDGSLEVLLKMLEKSPFREIPVILVTSNDNIELREKYFRLGVVDFIRKGEFSPERLKEHLEHYEKQIRMIEQLGSRSVAILDDSSLSLKVAKTMLSMYQIGNVETFDDAENLLNREKAYDIYLIDLVLPKITGEHIVVEIRKRFPFAVIIVVSSLEKYSTIAHVLDSGADDYIIKPFDARLLISRVKSNYRNYQMMKKLDEQNRIMEEMAVTDGLTGVKNHKYLMDRLKQEINHAVRHNRSFSVFLLDIDQFKSVNDTYGHPQGDLILKAISRHFTESIRDYDIFGRYGGEEFMLILPDTELDQAFSLADRLRSLFCQMEFPEVDTSLRVSFSGGLVEWSGEDSSLLLQKVDKLLYSAKRSGRNNIRK